jgi:hypothetical protein
MSDAEPSMQRRNALGSIPSRSAMLSATTSERMIFSPSFAATPAATSRPREPISLVIAITAMVDSRTAPLSIGVASNRALTLSHAARLLACAYPPSRIRAAGHPTWQAHHEVNPTWLEIGRRRGGCHQQSQDRHHRTHNDARHVPAPVR